MQTTKTVSQNQIQEKWYLVDAQGIRLGRLAGVVSQLLLGKDNVLTRDYLEPKNKVVVINADKLDVTQKRAETKIYTNYSGYPGGIKYTILGNMMAKFPGRVIEKAVRGMLPKNKRGKAIMASNLYVYAGNEHKHTAQQPQLVDLQTVKF